MKFKQLQQTPEELIINSKAVAGSTLVYKDKIYYKSKKDKVDVLTPLEMFYDIKYVLNDTPASIVLLKALCGHPKLTSFRGGYKEILYKINEEKVKFNNLDYEYFYNGQIKKDLNEEQEKLTKFINLSLKEKTQCISRSYRTHVRDSHDYKQGMHYYPWGINRYPEEERIKIKELYNNVGSTLSDVVFDNLYYTKGYKYDKNTMSFFGLVGGFKPQSHNENKYRVKVKYFRDLEDILPETKIKEVDLNTKTGDLFMSVRGGDSYDFSMNVYKESYNDEYFEHGLTCRMLINAVQVHYKKYKYMASHIIRNCIGDFYKSLAITDTKKFSNDLVKSVLILDRIINSPYVELFNNVHEYITIPKTKKWKLQDLLGISKQQLEKLNTYNKYEQRNYVMMVDILKNHYKELYTEENLNKLDDTTFLMINNSSIVDYVLKIVSRYYNIKFSQLKKIVEYVDVDAHERQCIGNVKYIYEDYIKYYKSLINAGYRTLESINFTPYSLMLEHNIVTHEYMMLKDEVEDSALKSKYDSTYDIITKKKYKYNGENIVFLPADSKEKLKNEGKSLSHCVGGYTSNIIEDKCVIFLARKEKDIDTSWFTVQIRKTVNGLVLGQQQSINEYKLPHELKEQLEKDIRKINAKHQEGLKRAPDKRGFIIV